MLSFHDTQRRNKKGIQNIWLTQLQCSNNTDVLKTSPDWLLLRRTSLLPRWELELSELPHPLSKTAFFLLCMGLFTLLTYSLTQRLRILWLCLHYFVFIVCFPLLEENNRELRKDSITSKEKSSHFSSH